MPKKVKSKKQAGFIGLVRVRKIKHQGLSPDEAKEMMEGTKASKLPERAKKKRKTA